MKRIVTALAVLTVLGFSVRASAHDMSKHGAAGHEKHSGIATVGEIVDMGCYLGHGGRGADHKSCASKCVAGGMPMGLLTGQGVLYILTMNHDNPDPYNKLKSMTGKKVTVTGEVMMRHGMKGIDVAGFKPIAV